MTPRADRPDHAHGGHARLAHLPLPRVQLPFAVVDARAARVPAPRRVPSAERAPRTAG